jgi:hypothetical protein
VIRTRWKCGCTWEQTQRTKVLAVACIRHAHTAVTLRRQVSLDLETYETKNARPEA